MLTKWVNAVEVSTVFGGFAVLVAGLYLLPTRPLPGVVAVLSAMALLLGSIAKLSELQEARSAVDAGSDRFPRRRPSGSGK